MKSLILITILLLSLNSLGCMNRIPVSEAIKAVALEPNAGSKTCEQLPSEECLCFDGIDWESAELVDEEVDGPERWSIPFNVTACQPEEECKKVIENPEFCEDGKLPFYRSMGDGFEAYCASKLPPKKIKTGKIVLTNIPAKLEERNQRIEKEKTDAKAAAKAKKDALARFKAADITKAATVKDLKAIMLDFQQSLAE